MPRAAACWAQPGFIHRTCWRPPPPPQPGVTKFDLQSGTIAGHVRHGGARLGGEAVFVPRRPGPIAPGSEDEDDGWLMTYVTGE